MTMTDPVADMLTRIRNGIIGSYDAVDVPSTKLKRRIANVMKSEGFIKDYKTVPGEGHESIRIFLKYDENGEPVIGGLKRVSKPGGRFYAKRDKIPRVLDGFGINILSTSKGVMTDRDARRLGVGGEVLCSIW